jgi:hypothetical protein
VQEAAKTQKTSSSLQKFGSFLLILSTLSLVPLASAVGRAIALRTSETAMALYIAVILLVVVAGVIVITLWKILKLTAPGVRTSAGYIVFVVFGIGLAVYQASRAYQAAPDFFIHSIKIDVRVNDIAGKSGHVQASTDLLIKANELSTIIWQDPNATGGIQDYDIRVLNAKYDSDIKTYGGKRQVVFSFHPTLKRGQIVTVTEKFDVNDSEPEPTVSWAYQSLFPTDSVAINLQVPRGRPCKSVRAQSEDATIIGGKIHEEQKPVLSEDRTQVQWSINQPEKGRAYKAICDW